MNARREDSKAYQKYNLGDKRTRLERNAPTINLDVMDQHHHQSGH